MGEVRMQWLNHCFSFVKEPDKRVSDVSFYGLMTTHCDQKFSKWLKAILGRNVTQ